MLDAIDVEPRTIRRYIANRVIVGMGGGGERKKEKKEEKNKREKHRGEIFCDLKLKAREGCPVLSAKESRSRVAESEDGNKLRRLMFGK